MQAQERRHGKRRVYFVVVANWGTALDNRIKKYEPSFTALGNVAIERQASHSYPLGEARMPAVF
jgi:hypothetical protein